MLLGRRDKGKKARRALAPRGLSPASGTDCSTNCAEDEIPALGGQPAPGTALGRTRWPRSPRLLRGPDRASLHGHPLL